MNAPIVQRCVKGTRPPLLAVLLMLAGCLDPVSEPGGTESNPVNDLFPKILALPEALRLGPGADAESSVDVSPDGKTILVCSHGGFTQPSPLWASTDAGATFRRVEPQPNQPFNGDCDISIGPAGEWSVVYDTVASATVAFSTDQGRTWTVNPLTAVPIGGVDRPWIHSAGDRTLYMTYTSVGTGAPDVETFAISSDGGLTWVQRPFLTPAPPERTRKTPGDMYVADNARTIRVPFIRTSQGGSPDFLENAISRDAGTTWSTERVAGPLPTASGIPGGARAADGTLFFSYSARQGGTGDVMVVWSHDDGKSWSEPTAVATNQSFAGLLGNVWVDGRPDGSATLLWVVQHEDPNGTTLWQHMAARIHVVNGLHVEWVLPAGPASGPHPSNLYEFSTVRHDGSGRAHMAFPLVTGPDCKETPAFPSQVGSQNIPRNTACQYLVIEKATMAP